MVDFSKAIKSKKTKKSGNPLEIYDELDRSTTTGPLRNIQREILENWFDKRRNDKDLIIKLDTGTGKTLIGLLILQSKLNLDEGPCLYLCPNKYLVEQVCDEAKKFGINYCEFKDNQLPQDFQTGKKILITTVQKLFNGKTVFGLDNTYEEIGCIIMDDSHACIDAINDALTININKNKDDNMKEIYEQIFDLFKNDLLEQGEGSFLEIQEGSNNTIMKIPYWAWDEKNSNVLRILNKYKILSEINFVWPFIKDNIINYKAYISGNKIEITPYIIPINRFKSFYDAKNRILMSATTQNDSFFIKGLRFSKNAILSPLESKGVKWTGEKMVLIPSLIADEFNRKEMIKLFAKVGKKRFGCVALVSSNKKAEDYKQYKCIIANKETIFDTITNLKIKKLKEKTVIIVNRYDGIDLPDNACRILVIDSLPYAKSLDDKYNEICRGTSDIINIKIAQKIEQGLGRSVRGEKDFSSIILIGTDLIKFITTSNNLKYFSSQTKQQIKIGLKISKLAKEDYDEYKDDKSNSNKVIKGLINQLLTRDEGWKDFYKSSMDSMEHEQVKSNGILDILLLETEAQNQFELNNIEKACEKIQKIVDSVSKNTVEKGWYLQELARYKYRINKIESNIIQTSAFNNNFQLLKPKEGISYTKINTINSNRIEKIKNFMSKYNNYKEFKIDMDDLLDGLYFGQVAEKFEDKLDNIGKMLGFETQRPDKNIRKGPDNLWYLGNKFYIMFECKSEVNKHRDAIHKFETGQMNNHCGWFEEQYRDDDKLLPILIIPTKNLAYDGNFTHNVQIMRESKLNEFTKNIKAYVHELKAYDIKNLNDTTISQLLENNNLDVESIKKIYTENYIHISNAK